MGHDTNGEDGEKGFPMTRILTLLTLALFVLSGTLTVPRADPCSSNCTRPAPAPAQMGA